ncbi:Ltp family lipoprotein [Ligilactobacillus acidipiscis]|uniref:Ltp family lipoprotein n=1 Tax=Ligilactobacillus acidipiscis TaxID=89059 RepID=UPI0023F78F89|nr:Ltp family lipoprotein [Ligilactobacillus acidipiscis]WEV56171.1 Ltp family lipoprotein [Ligilactobacillus acidipiscis]
MSKKQITGEDGKKYTVKEKKPFYKRVWFWILVIVVVFIGVGSMGGGSDDKAGDSTKTEQKSDKTNSSKQSSSEAKVPAEYKAAMRKGQTYADTMNMSKAGIYDQLTSQDGEGFPAKAAQYAVDNIKADYNKNALKKAKSYRDDQDMSNDAIHDQLTSDAGEKFTSQEADYAIQHIDD